MADDTTTPAYRLGYLGTALAIYTYDLGQALARDDAGLRAVVTRIVHEIQERYLGEGPLPLIDNAKLAADIAATEE